MRLACRVLLGVAVLALASSTFGSTFSFSFAGNFINDNDLQKFSFTVVDPTVVTMQSWGFAGGTNAQNIVIPPGGFATALALFDNNGMQVGNVDQGGFLPNNCGPRHVDQGLCLDAYLSETLLAGNYTLVLSQQPNVPNDIFLADGYTFDGDPNFAGGFNDFGLQRTSAWAVDITGSSVPEPSSVLFLFAGLSWLIAIAWKRSAKGEFMKSKQRSAVGRVLGIAMLLVTPSLMRATELHVVADTFINSAAPTVNNGTQTSITVGNGGANIALVQMDLGALPAGLTAANIQKATLTIFVNKVLVGGGLDFSQVTSAWTETGVTFSPPPSIAPAFAINAPITATGAFVTVDVTSLVQGWVQGTFPNNGIAIAAAVASPSTWVLLDSKETTTTSHPASIDVVIASVGPTGPSGPIGATGPTGPSGAPGGAGPSGPSGPPGLAGPSGPSGPQGVAGPSGPSGPAGPSGAQGVAGPSGPSGPAGPSGAQGVAGPSGPTGVQGPAGPTGPTGVMGITGAAGPTGPTGPSGPSGPTGLSGAGTVFTFNVNSAAASPEFYPMNGSVAGPSTVYAVAQTLMPAACTFNAMYISATPTSASPAADTITLTLFKNGSATAMAVTVISSTTTNTPTTANTTSNPVSVVAGDSVAIQVSQSNTAPIVRLSLTSRCI